MSATCIQCGEAFDLLQEDTAQRLEHHNCGRTA